ncbi:hypothetical protein [Phenylobacterium sp.]|uniref:hypothetical protein n=1 Tax=Phenylobacterium sp. TaxID=1871053 RepID=UPI0012023A53|nr:hypothetical protein [Phenylobacterium sp.]TAL30671.1 MAG: hypothetical protein EPN98_17415 [Phenylobacterium sp.]
MRRLVLALAAGFLVFGPAAAQPTPASPKYTLETPIHELMEDPKMLAWLDRHFPGLSERMRDPEVGALFAGVSIQGLSIDPDHGRALTPEVMAKLKVSLEKAQETPAVAPPAS